MKVNPDVLRSVGFVGCRKASGEYLLKGSAFFIAMEQSPSDPGKAKDVYWVTARHVIEGIRRLGCTEVYLRLNDKAGQARWHSTAINHWFSLPDDPSCDIAVYCLGLSNWMDHAVIGPDLFFNDVVQERLRFGPTDEIAVVGLFRHRAGNARNVPIVRSGSIASLDHAETVTTDFGEMPAFLIECRSIGGLSGSPVFVLTGLERAWNRTAENGEKGMFLLGLIHGHYDVTATDIDAIDAATGLRPDQVNTGIAIVTPLHRLWPVIAAHKEHLRAISLVPPLDFIN